MATLRKIAPLVAVLAALLLGGCGFQLRGSYTLPYESLYVALPSGSVVGATLKRQIRASGGTRIADTQEDAQAVFQQVTETREELILALNSSGRVSQLRLRYRFAYRVTDGKGHDLVPVTGIELIRDMIYDDSAVLAKDQEKQLLWHDMENDLAQQLLRRLAASKPAYAQNDH